MQPQERETECKKRKIREKQGKAKIRRKEKSSLKILSKVFIYYLKLENKHI